MIAVPVGGRQTNVVLTDLPRLCRTHISGEYYKRHKTRHTQLFPPRAKSVGMDAVGWVEALTAGLPSPKCRDVSEHVRGARRSVTSLFRNNKVSAAGCSCVTPLLGQAKRQANIVRPTAQLACSAWLLAAADLPGPRCFRFFGT